MGNCFGECLERLFLWNRYKRINEIPLLHEDYFSYINPIYTKKTPRTRYELLQYYKTLDKFRPSVVNKRIKKVKRKKKKKDS
jgi:hypothetical protein